MNRQVPTNKIRIERLWLIGPVIINPDDSTICDEQSTNKPSFAIVASKIEDFWFFVKNSFGVEKLELFRFGESNGLLGRGG